MVAGRNPLRFELSLIPAGDDSILLGLATKDGLVFSFDQASQKEGRPSFCLTSFLQQAFTYPRQAPYSNRHIVGIPGFLIHFLTRRQPLNHSILSGIRLRRTARPICCWEYSAYSFAKELVYGAPAHCDPAAASAVTGDSAKDKIGQPGRPQFMPRSCLLIKPPFQSLLLFLSQIRSSLISFRG